MAAKAKTSPSETAAQQILDDLNGAGFYATEEAMAGFVQAILGTSVITSAQIANGIINDWNGPKVMDEAHEVAAYIDKQIARPDAPEPGSKVE